MPPESLIEGNSTAMTAQANEPAPQRPSSKLKWIGMLAIAFGLAAISLGLWLKVSPIDTETEVATSTPVYIQSSQLTVQAQHVKAVSEKQPASAPEEQLSDASKADANKVKKQPVPVPSGKPSTARTAKPATHDTAVADSQKAGQGKSAVATKSKAMTNKSVAKKAVGKQPKLVASDKPAPTASVKASGNWAVVLSSESSEKAAIEQQIRMRATGVETEYVRAINGGRVWYRIQVSGFSNKQEAKKQRAILAKKLGIPDVWLTRMDFPTP